MKRELSVEDLFVPLNRLDVRHPSSSAEMGPQANPRVADVSPSETARGDAKARASLFESHGRQPDLDRSVARLDSAFTLDMAPIPEEAALPSQVEKLCIPGYYRNMDCSSEEAVSAGPGMVSNNKDYAHMPKGSSTTSKANASVSDGMGLQTQGNSTSDEDQQILDDRKQRRMLSNRESARRSRLRKQQHLDELKGHVAQLQAQNSQMLNSFNLASQQFAQVTEENRKLRSEAMNLSHQLQRLHHTVSSQRANNGLRYGADARQIVQNPQY